MKKLLFTSLLIMLIFVMGGCYSDIATTKELKTLDRKCIYFGDIKCEIPNVTEIIKDCLVKEFIKARFDICDEVNATMILSGDIFIASKEDFSGGGGFGSGGGAIYAGAEKKIVIDSASVRIKMRDGTLLAVGSYNNWNNASVERVGYFLGCDLANKLK